ncbi:hypothetical protein ACFL1T_05060, partial [Chlamydiota bacterium]
IYISHGIKEGEYRGNITFFLNEKKQTIPIVITVFKFSLPNQTRVKTQLFSIDRKEIARRYNLDVFSSDYEEFIKEIFEKYKSHRISPGHPTPILLKKFYEKYNDPQKLAAYYEKWCKYWINAGLDCNNIVLPKNSNKLEPYVKDMYTILQVNNWFNKVYVRLPYDEAKVGVKAEKNLLWAKEIKRIMPQVKIHQTFGGLERGLNKESLDFYKDFVDIWSVVPNAYFESNAIKKTLDERIQRGDKISWYIHRNMNVWQSWRTLRYFFWNMWCHNISMVTHWRTTFWSRPIKYKKKGAIKIPRVPEKRTWREERGFGSTRSSGIGNGTLFWPEKDKVLTSIRLEVIRDGIEDYEYFVLSKRKGISVDFCNEEYREKNILLNRIKYAQEIEKNFEK